MKGVEGTVRLEGLLEAGLPDARDLEPALRRWLKQCAALGVDFSLELEADGFSLLPEDRPFPAAPLGSCPEAALRQMVQKVVELVPEGDRGSLLSTLRSRELRPGEEVQSLYPIGGDGEVRVESRIVEAETTPPPAAAPTQRLKHVGLALAAVLVLVIGLSLVVDLTGLLDMARAAALGPALEADDIDLRAYAGLLEVGALETDARALTLTLHRGPAFPADSAALQAAWEAEPALARRLALEALARGYGRCELFDADGRCLASPSVRLAGLRDADSLTVRLPVRPAVVAWRLVP